MSGAEHLPVDLEVPHPARFQIRASGEVTLREIEALYAKVLGHPDLAPGADAIVDTSGVVQVPNAAELRAAASGMRPILDRGLGAVGVVAEDAYVYGMARMFSVFAEAVGAQVHAFRCTADAERWLKEQRGPSGPASAPET